VFSWIIRILNEQAKVKFESSIAQFTPLILDLLVKHALHIQYQTLSLLDTIYEKCPKSLTGNENTIIEALLGISEEESLIPLIYQILNAIVRHVKIKPEVIDKTLIETIKILDNHKQVGSQLNSLFEYVHASAKLIDQKKIFSYLDTFIDFDNMNLNKARCLAILAANGGADKNLIKTCVAKLSTNMDENSKRNVLSLLGDVCLFSKESHAELLANLEGMLNSATEDMKMGIAISLGKIGVTDPTAFTKMVLANSATNTHYYFLAIREFLNVFSEGSTVSIDNVTAPLFKFLVQSSSHEEEKLRIICGECVGLMATISEGILNDYVSLLTNSDKVIRATFYYGLKYIFNSRLGLKEHYVEKLLEYLIAGLKDDDIAVKQNAFNSLINFAHSYGGKIKPKYIELMSIFGKEHIINQALIDVVDIGGGMKIKNDKGIYIRKAIYSTIKILLDAIPEKVNVTDSLQICFYGLGILFYVIYIYIDDSDDIQALAHGCLLKIAHLFPEAFIALLDALCDNFKGKLDKLKPTTTTQNTLDVKKKADLVANIKRLFDELKKVHEIEENPKFVDLNNEIQTFSA
jgi:hypothetical protein